MPEFDNLKVTGVAQLVDAQITTTPGNLAWKAATSVVIPIPLNFVCRTLHEAILNSTHQQDWNLDYTTGGYECDIQDGPLQAGNAGIATMSWVPPKGTVTGVTWIVKGGTAHAGATTPASYQQLWTKRLVAAGSIVDINTLVDNEAAATYHTVRTAAVTGLSVAVDPTIGDRIHFYLFSEYGANARLGYTIFGLSLTMTLDTAFVYR